jgi:hypothetical protein
MPEFVPSIVTFLLLCLGACAGRWLHPRLPETYRTRESLETMQLVIGMLVTFAALVLGLLTASVKSSYDGAARDRHAYALRLTQLDRCLRDYGSETKQARDDLVSYTAAVIASTWPREPPPANVRYPNTAGMPVVGASPVLGDLMDQVGREIRSLQPRGPVAAATADDCRVAYRDVLQARMVVIQDASTRFPTPFFWVLVAWLTVIFLALGLASPRNRLSLFGVLMCALTLSSAVFVITDMSLPYRGLMGISSETMREALTTMTAAGER